MPTSVSCVTPLGRSEVSLSTHLVPLHGVHETATPCLFLTFHEKKQIHAKLSRAQQVRSGTSNGENRALIICSSARIQVPITRCQLERVALPSLWRCGDHIVMPLRACCISVLIAESTVDHDLTHRRGYAVSVSVFVPPESTQILWDCALPHRPRRANSIRSICWLNAPHEIKLSEKKEGAYCFG